MAKRRRKRPYEVSKRCHCPDRTACAHHWFLRVYADGKRQRIDLTERFPGDSVEVAAAKAKDLARQGLLTTETPTDARLTLGDVADRYVAARGNRKHYYLDGLRQIEVPAAKGATIRLEDKPVDEVTTADIKYAVSVWRKRPKTVAGAKRGAVAERHLLQTGRHMFNWAMEEGYTTHSPFYSAQGVPIIHIKTTKGRSRRLEDGEEKRLREAACPYIADFFTAMIETGCRPGELRTLQWSEVRGEHIVILAEKAKDREERKVPIMPALQEVLDRRRKGPDGNDLPPDAYVFGNETGEEMKKRRLCALWQETCERAKVKNLHLHDLRAEAGSQLLEAGATIHDVRDALGHSSTTMTSTYLRTRVNSLTKAYQQRAAHRARQALRLARGGQSGQRRKSS